MYLKVTNLQNIYCEITYSYYNTYFLSLIKKLCRRMVWLWHVENAAVVKNAVETTVTSPKTTIQLLKARLFIQIQKHLKLDFIPYGPALEFYCKNNPKPLTKTNAGCIC